MAELEVSPEHAADPNTRRVGIAVGIVGIFLSIVTIASHRAHTQAVILRTESNDIWAEYQAKKIRATSSDVGATILTILAADPAKAADAVHKLEATRDRQLGETEGLQKDARAKEGETEHEEKRALKFDIGEGLLELGLVLTSLYFLARNAFFPIFGLLSALGGIALGIAGWVF